MCEKLLTPLAFLLALWELVATERENQRERELYQLFSFNSSQCLFPEPLPTTTHCNACQQIKWQWKSLPYQGKYIVLQLYSPLTFPSWNLSFCSWNFYFCSAAMAIIFVVFVAIMIWCIMWYMTWYSGHIWLSFEQDSPLALLAASHLFMSRATTNYYNIQVCQDWHGQYLGYWVFVCCKQWWS